MKKRFWIIDQDSQGESRESHSAIGPFPTIKEAKARIRADNADLYLNSCGCMRGDSELPWTLPKLIVEEVVRLQVTPVATCTVKLKQIEPTPLP